MPLLHQKKVHAVLNWIKDEESISNSTLKLNHACGCLQPIWVVSNGFCHEENIKSLDIISEKKFIHSSVLWICDPTRCPLGEVSLRKMRYVFRLWKTASVLCVMLWVAEVGSSRGTLGKGSSLWGRLVTERVFPEKQLGHQTCQSLRNMWMTPLVFKVVLWGIWS